MKFEQMCGCLYEGTIICTIGERRREREKRERRESSCVLTFNLLHILVEKKHIPIPIVLQGNDKYRDLIDCVFWQKNKQYTCMTTGRMNSLIPS